MSCELYCSWIDSWITSSSDSRIKEDIEDINDDSGLQMILTIGPKTYKIIDNVTKCDKKVYGFITQQIREVLPDDVSRQPNYIPNIMLLADYDNECNILERETWTYVKCNCMCVMVALCDDKNCMCTET